MKLFILLLELFEKLIPGSGSADHLAKSGRLPLLLVDDEQGSLLLLTRTLKRCSLQFKDAEIETASSIKSARERLKSRRFSVVFVDIRFPGEISGVEFGKELENDYPDMRVIFFPGNLDDLKEVGNSTFFEGIGKGLYMQEAVERALRRSCSQEPASVRTATIFYVMIALAFSVGVIAGSAGAIEWLARQIKKL